MRAGRCDTRIGGGSRSAALYALRNVASRKWWTFVTERNYKASEPFPVRLDFCSYIHILLSAYPTIQITNPKFTLHLCTVSKQRTCSFIFIFLYSVILSSITFAFHFIFISVSVFLQFSVENACSCNA
jgi:hypothetical protein